MHARCSERARPCRLEYDHRTSRIFYVSTEGKLRDRDNYTRYLWRLWRGNTSSGKRWGKGLREHRRCGKEIFRSCGDSLNSVFLSRIRFVTEFYIPRPPTLKEKVNTHASSRYNIESTVHLNINELRERTLDLSMNTLYCTERVYVIQTCNYVAPGGDHNTNTSVTQCINISQIRPRWLKTLASLAPPVYTRQELWIEKRNLERTAGLCSSGANERTIRLPLWKYRVT